MNKNDCRNSNYLIRNFHYPNGVPRLVADTIVDILENATLVASERLHLPPRYALQAYVKKSYVYLTDPNPTADWYNSLMEKRSLNIIPAKLRSFSKEWTLIKKKIWSVLSNLSHQIRFETNSSMIDLLNEAIQFQKWVWIEHFYFMILGLIAFEIRYHIVPEFKRNFSTNYLNRTISRTLTPIEKKLLLCGIEGLNLGIITVRKNDTIGYNYSHKKYLDWLDNVKKENYYFGLRLDTALDISNACWFENDKNVIARVKGLLEEHRNKKLLYTESNSNEIGDITLQEEASVLFRLFKEVDFFHWKEEHGPFLDLTASVPLRALLLKMSGKIDHYQVTPKLMSYASLDELKECAYLIDNRKQISDKLVNHWLYHQQQHLENIANPPPEFIGVPKQFSNPILRYIHGYNKSSCSCESETSMEGVPSSGGIASGPIRHIFTYEDLEKLKNGDIVVCDSFLPAWRLMIPKIAGCISARGGLLSHTSILCREMKVPCIISCGKYIWSFPEGDIVEIDGYSGKITKKING